MDARKLLALACATALAASPFCTGAHAAPADDAAALRQQLEAADAEAKAAQARQAAIRQQLAAAQQAATSDMVDRAGAGDAAALKQLLDRFDGKGSVVDYAWARAVKSPAAKDKAMPEIRERLKSPEPIQRGKLCWLLGQIGTESAAAMLREVVSNDPDENVVGNAIGALARCPDSPASVEAVRKHVGDVRKLTRDIGYYSRGTFGNHPLGITAREYVERRNAAAFPAVAGEVLVETPSLFCAGFQWKIEGDSNHNATVNVEYRKAAGGAWVKGSPFLRCKSWEDNNPKYNFDVGNLLAGSIFDLEPGTEYEVKLALADPDGGAAENTVRVTTRKEPPHYEGLRTLYVAPGAGGGAGSQADPYKGLVVADAAAKPGDVFILLPGTYTGSVSLKKNGQPGKPIVWRGSDRNAVILDGTGQDESISMKVVDWVQFEDLTFHGSKQGCMKTYGCQNIVVRRCIFKGFNYCGIVGQGFPGGKLGKREVPPRNAAFWFVTDNEVYGPPAKWTKGRKGDSYNINVAGYGHVIAWNRSQDCWDAISLAGGRGEPKSGALDICYNDLRQAVDDGVEADYVYHNTRVYRNRLWNTFSTLSNQPVYGGPGYMLHNAMYNTTNKPFKLHVDTTGMIIAHNTCVSWREAWDGGSFHDAFLWNNLLLGVHPQEDGYWLNVQGAPLTMDYAGYTVNATPVIKLNNVRYQTMQEFAEATGQMKHSVEVGLDVFVNAPPPPGHKQIVDPSAVDLRLRPGSKAVDAGTPLPGINDGFIGKAPDLGCYELGRPVPHYGPRMDLRAGAQN